MVGEGVVDQNNDDIKPYNKAFTQFATQSDNPPNNHIINILLLYFGL